MENKTLTAVEQLIELIPSGAEIKTAIFEGDMDEKMLDEWLWERIFKGKDFLALEKEQHDITSLDWFLEGERYAQSDKREYASFELYYTTKYGKQ